MKKCMVRAFCAMCLASVLLVGMAVTASAAEPDGGRLPDYSKEIEEVSKWLDGLTLTPSGGTSGQEQPTAPAEPPKLLTGDELDAYAYKVYELVNREREKAGASPLDYREDIAEAATLRANEIVGNYTHTRPDGSKYHSIFTEYGITRVTSGENIYKSPTTPEAAMRGWMDSDGHRKNILKESYTAMGVGLYQDQDGKLYWVQLFIMGK